MSAEMNAIYSGEGAQAVEVYAVDASGRTVAPSSATVRIVDLDLPETDGGREIVAVTTATVDATSTVITAAAGAREADNRKIVVTSASGIVAGRRYALSVSGRLEVFELDRVEGLTLYTTAPLTSAVSFPASSSSVVGLRVSGEFPAIVADAPAQLSSAGDEVRKVFGVDWTFAGVTGPAAVRTLARIERRGKLPRASRWDVLEIDPQIQQAQHARGTVEAALRRADKELDALLLHAGHRLADTTFGAVASIAVSWRAVELVYQSLGPDHAARAAAAKIERERWTALVLDGRRPDDAVEVSRVTDARRGRRTRLGVL